MVELHTLLLRLLVELNDYFHLGSKHANQLHVGLPATGLPLFRRDQRQRLR
jgi:hypothetical protein